MIFVDELLMWFDDVDTDVNINVNVKKNGGEMENLYILPYTVCDRETADVAANVIVDVEINVDRYDLAAQSFLRLLSQLRIIFLQDLVIIKREFSIYIYFLN